MNISPQNKPPNISIIILNFNTDKLLSICLKSIADSSLENLTIETIIVDNHSADNSIKEAQVISNKYQKQLNPKYLLLKSNLGFAAGNNRGISLLHPLSKYVLFLNPDTTLKPDCLQGVYNYLQKNPNIDAATCAVILAKNNQLQPECHRGFPTPQNSFFYFTGIYRLFPKSPIFNGYFLGHLDLSLPHTIDACVGAFIMLNTSVGKKIGWWNEKYFFYGEDLDFCYQLKKHHFSLWFIPQFQITHYQGISSGIKKTKSKASRQTRIRSAKASTQAMRIFYQTNLFSNYSYLTKLLVNFGIDLLEFTRIIKAKYF